MTKLDIRKKLAENGVKVTPSRLLIYNYLISSKEHPSADMVYTALSPGNPKLSRTTVYNTLRTFCDIGVAKMLPISDEDMRFDADISLHAHFRCLKCHKIHDLILIEKDLATIVEVPMELVVTSGQLILSGYCSGCSSC